MYQLTKDLKFQASINYTYTVNKVNLITENKVLAMKILNIQLSTMSCTCSPAQPTDKPHSNLLSCFSINLFGKF